MIDIKTGQPLVSIIVPTYNSAIHIIETLESARAQTYQNIELIVTDDSSGDDTVEICRDWIEKNQDRFVRTEVITAPENTGIPANCNRGLLSANGDWLKFIGSDDVLLDNCIADNIDHVNNNPGIPVLFSNINAYKNEFSEKNFIQRVPLVPPTDLINDKITANQQYQMLLISDRVGYVASYFINRLVLLKVGGFDEKYRLMEDNPLWLRLTRAGYKLHFMDKLTINYRFHEYSVSHYSDPHLVSPTFLRNEPFRKEYIYPNLSWEYKFDYHYKYRISEFLSRIFNNKSNYFTRFVYRILIKWINPFYYYLGVLRVINRTNRISDEQ